MDLFLSQKFRFYSFISMLLLVFVHGYNLNDRYLQPWSIVQEPLTFTTFAEYFLANAIFRFRIPMLFAISGFLFALYDNKPHKNRIKKRARTLLLPYLIWSVIGLLVAVLITFNHTLRDVVYSTHLQPSEKPFDNYTFGDWLLAIVWPTSYQLWFLRALFVYNLIYPLLVKGLQKIPTVLFIIFGFLWLTTFGMIFLEGEGLLFFTLGIWLCKTNKNVQQLPKWFSLPIFTLLFLVAAVVKTFLAFSITELGLVTWLMLSLLHKLVVLTGLLVVWFGGDTVVRYFMNKKWFIHLSAFSFTIYALHVPILTYLIDPAFKLVHFTQYYRLVTFIGLPIVIIVFCMLVGWLLRRMSPVTYGILTGGRGFNG